MMKKNKKTYKKYRFKKGEFYLFKTKYRSIILMYVNRSYTRREVWDFYSKRPKKIYRINRYANFKIIMSNHNKYKIGKDFKIETSDNYWDPHGDLSKDILKNIHPLEDKNNVN